MYNIDKENIDPKDRGQPQEDDQPKKERVFIRPLANRLRQIAKEGRDENQDEGG